jgi:hypothetical protein
LRVKGKKIIDVIEIKVGFVMIFKKNPAKTYLELLLAADYIRR